MSETPSFVTSEVMRFSKANEIPKIKELIDSLTKTTAEKFSGSDLSQIEDALMLSTTLHVNQKNRPGGEPYINHILSVANRTASLMPRPDKDLVIAALMHDSVEDQSERLGALSPDDNADASVENATDELTRKYGSRVTEIVGKLSNPDFDKILAAQGINQNNPDFAERKRQLYAEHVAEAIEDPDVFIIKLADFTDNAMSALELPENTEAQQSKKIKLLKKYLPVIQIFIEKMEEENTFPELREQYKTAYNNYQERLGGDE